MYDYRSYYEKIVETLDNMGIGIEIKTSPDLSCFVDLSTFTIYIPDIYDDEEKFWCLLHESGHMLVHMDGKDNGISDLTDTVINEVLAWDYSRDVLLWARIQIDDTTFYLKMREAIEDYLNT